MTYSIRVEKSESGDYHVGCYSSDSDYHYSSDVKDIIQKWAYYICYNEMHLDLNEEGYEIEYLENGIPTWRIEIEEQSIALSKFLIDEAMEERIKRNIERNIRESVEKEKLERKRLKELKNKFGEK
ncbi:MAG: hypothetical protein KAS32_13585 [Candidatus Peribacteraceae bacterium]|nr:hypothetical protein [Candidatus Peribacteraceae bacterium]